MEIVSLLTELDTNFNRALLIIRRKGVIESLHPPGLLLLLGLPKETVYFTGETGAKARMRKQRLHGSHCKRKLLFWERGDIMDLFVLAKKEYISKMKSVHPDVASGKHKEAVQLNQIWARLKQLYRKHGLCIT